MQMADHRVMHRLGRSVRRNRGSGDELRLLQCRGLIRAQQILMVKRLVPRALAKKKKKKKKKKKEEEEEEEEQR